MKASLWKLQVIPLQDKTLVSGIAIKGAPRIHNLNDTKITSFKRVIQAYFHLAYRHENIIVEADGERLHAKTRSHGEFRVEFSKPISSRVKVYDTSGENELKSLQDYPISFNLLDSAGFVITDIDDTIIRSYSLNAIRKLNILLFRSPVKRKKIEATSKAFELINKAHFQFIYLSRSEYNLFNLITSFIKLNNLPIAPLFLRKLTHWRGLFNQKGKALFKYSQLDEIVKHFPVKKFIFFGDDSQADLEVYIHYANLFPESVLAIFIHRVKKRIRKKEREFMKADELKNVHFYSEFEEIESIIEKLNNEIAITNNSRSL